MYKALSSWLLFSRCSASASLTLLPSALVSPSSPPRHHSYITATMYCNFKFMLALNFYLCALESS
ncbi:hypothetical protein DFH08DRAFT_872075 [Mycena albidolilacea]|uniref:Secreted protein n=1 Tax=Mycena albidolilacea TaxID=1033008 RepID=A0AAD6ZWT9_9AGAR|nr:hypothetical protein DFH08DRAFT_872075 [Mycena albidolilacea]